MKFSVVRETLLKPLQLVAGVVERKQTMPVLANVLVEVKDQTLTLTGSDLEVELVGHVAFIFFNFLKNCHSIFCISCFI